MLPIASTTRHLLGQLEADGQQHRAEQQRLALEKQRDRRKQADLDAGRLVRIRIEYPGEPPITALYPTRVAAFACKVLGQATSKGVRVMLSSQQRSSAACYPEQQVELAVLALRSHARAVVRKECRRAGKPLPNRQKLRSL